MSSSVLLSTYRANQHLLLGTLMQTNFRQTLGFGPHLQMRLSFWVIVSRGARAQKAAISLKFRLLVLCRFVNQQASDGQS